MGTGCDGLDRRSLARDVWAALGRQDLLRSLYVHGDPSAPLHPDRLGSLLAELDERCSVGTTLATVVQLATTVPLLSGAGNAMALVDEVLDGRSSVALAVTDAHSGTDLLGMTTTAGIGERTIEVTGAKRWIAGGGTADAFLVLARHRSERHFTSFAWVLVPARHAGVTVIDTGTDRFSGGAMSHVAFDAVTLGRDAVVGRPGRALAEFARHISVERLAGALWAVALCRRAIATTVDRLALRPASSGTLWDADAIRQRVARCVVRVQSLDALTRALAPDVVAAGDTTAGATLKVAAADVVAEILAECAQLHGADGFERGGMQDLRAEAAVFGIGGGPTEVALSMVGDAAERVLASLRRERVRL